jgi:Tol biopolymer transport system component
MKNLILTFFSISLLLILSCSNEADKQNIPKSEYLQLPKSFTGKIAFQSDKDGDNEIYLLTKEGIKQLTNNNYQDEYPIFSPDGNWILFQSNPKGGDNYDIYIMKYDGTNVKPILETSNKESEATFYSKDLKTIAYTYNDQEIHIFNVTQQKDNLIEKMSGRRSILPIWSPVNNFITYTGKRALGWDVALYKNEHEDIIFLTQGGKSCRGRWSHKGDKIAFVSQRADGKGDIWIMNADGTNQQRITYDDDTYEYYPAWAPDDNQIVYSSSTDKKKGNWSLWVIDLGTKQKYKIYDSAGQDVFPSWAK